MDKKTYLQPTILNTAPQTLDYICGDLSLPYGGDDGPGEAEAKEREIEEEPTEPEIWGTLW